MEGPSKEFILPLTASRRSTEKFSIGQIIKLPSKIPPGFKASPREQYDLKMNQCHESWTYETAWDGFSKKSYTGRGFAPRSNSVPFKYQF